MLPIKYIHPVMLLDMEDIPYHSLETVPFYTVYSCILKVSVSLDYLVHRILPMHFYNLFLHIPAD